MKSAATVPRRTRTAAGVAAPRAKRARRKERRARRRIPGPALVLAPGPAPGQGSKIVPGSPTQRAATSLRVMTRRVSPRGAPAPVHTHPMTPNLGPGPNLSPSPNPAPPPQLKPAPTPAPPPVQNPAPNPAPHLAHAPVPAHSSDFGLSVISPHPTVSSSSFTFPQTAPCLFLNISSKIPGHSLDVDAHATPFHLAFTLNIFSLELCCMEVFCKITVQSQFYKFE